MNVVVLQTDNRPVADYRLMSQLVNKKQCAMLDYSYQFEKMDFGHYQNMDPKTGKIIVVNEFIKNNFDYELLVFLDSDAWIQNPLCLHELLNKLRKYPDKHGCYSRDPYCAHNTFINSGSFILKLNDYTKLMYGKVIEELHAITKKHNQWPHDQYYLSRYVFNNKEDFMIFKPKVINTPEGLILRHNWWKNNQMNSDMKTIIEGKNMSYDSGFNFDKNLDDNPYPNLEAHGVGCGYEYLDVDAGILE